jgi:hypothetical protein
VLVYDPLDIPLGEVAVVVFVQRCVSFIAATLFRFVVLCTSSERRCSAQNTREHTRLANELLHTSSLTRLRGEKQRQSATRISFIGRARVLVLSGARVC